MSEYKAAFFVVPSRILELPGLTLQLLRFYETIFQFWNHGKICFLSNELLMERSGMSSKSTVQEAFEYFEKFGEMKREFRDHKRYILSPQQQIELNGEPVDNSVKDRTKTALPLATARPPTRHSETPPLATARHNNKNINIKNINKSVCGKKPLKSHKSVLCPEDFTPNEKHYLLGEQLGVDPSREAEAMIDWSRSKDEKRTDWDRTFNNWLRNEHKFNKARGQRNGQAKNGILFDSCKQSLEQVKRESRLTAEDRALISQMG